MVIDYAEHEPTQEQRWQDALCDLAECLSVKQLTRAGVHIDTISAMIDALEAPQRWVQPRGGRELEPVQTPPQEGA